MTHEEEKALFRKVGLAHLDFLVQDFGFRLLGDDKIRINPDPRAMDVSLVFQNETTGISCQTTSHGTELGVSLYRLAEGQFSESEGKVYGLVWIVLLRRPSLKLGVNLSVPKRISQLQAGMTAVDVSTAVHDYKAERFSKAFAKTAEALQMCASDILAGNFSVFSELSHLSSGQWDELARKR